MATWVTVPTLIASGTSGIGYGGLDLGRQVHPALVGVAAAIGLIYLLAWVNVAAITDTDRGVNPRLRNTLLAAIVPLLAVFAGALTIQVFEVLGW